MKKILILVLFNLLVSSSLFACGDIELWQERYFNGQQLSALKFIHCSAIYKKYQNKKETDGMILKMITDAVSLYEKIKSKNKVVATGYRDLALKNLMIFNQLKTIKGTIEYNKFIQQLAIAYAINESELKSKLNNYSEHVPKFFKIENTFHNNVKYCEIVAKEVAMFFK